MTKREKLVKSVVESIIPDEPQDNFAAKKINKVNKNKYEWEDLGSCFFSNK